MLDPAASQYTDDSGRDYHEHKRALHPEALEWVLALRAEKLQPHVRPADVVFELGVGSGWNLARLRCARRIGSDAALFLARRVAAHGIEFVDGMESVPDAMADVVLCHHTLEHLLAPVEALRQVARILKPGGKLVLHVPWERERRYARFKPGDPNRHLHIWNAQSLGNLVSLLGYQIESVGVRRYGYDRFAANLAVRIRAGQWGYRVGRRVLVALRPLWEVELVALRQSGVQG